MPLAAAEATGTGLIMMYHIEQQLVAQMKNTHRQSIKQDETGAKRGGRPDPVISFDNTMNMRTGSMDELGATTLATSALVDGDGFTGTLSREAGEAAGTYAITPGTLDAGGNNAITFVGADFVITARNQGTIFRLH